MNRDVDNEDMLARQRAGGAAFWAEITAGESLRTKSLACWKIICVEQGEQDNEPGRGKWKPATEA